MIWPGLICLVSTVGLTTQDPASIRPIWARKWSGSIDQVVAITPTAILLEGSIGVQALSIRDGHLLWKSPPFAFRNHLKRISDQSSSEIFCSFAGESCGYVVRLSDGATRQVEWGSEGRFVAVQRAGSSFLVCLKNSAGQLLPLKELRRGADKISGTLSDQVIHASKDSLLPVGSELYRPSNSKLRHATAIAVELSDYTQLSGGDNPQNCVADRSRQIHRLGTNSVLSYGSENWHDTSGMGSSVTHERQFLAVYRANDAKLGEAVAPVWTRSEMVWQVPHRVISAGNVFSSGSNLLLTSDAGVHWIGVEGIEKISAESHDSYLQAGLSLVGVKKASDQSGVSELTELVSGKWRRLGTISGAIYPSKDATGVFLVSRLASDGSVKQIACVDLNRLSLRRESFQRPKPISAVIGTRNGWN